MMADDAWAFLRFRIGVKTKSMPCALDGWCQNYRKLLDVHISHQCTALTNDCREEYVSGVFLHPLFIASLNITIGTVLVLCVVVLEDMLHCTFL